MFGWYHRVRASFYFYLYRLVSRDSNILLCDKFVAYEYPMQKAFRRRTYRPTEYSDNGEWRIRIKGRIIEVRLCKEIRSYLRGPSTKDHYKFASDAPNCSIDHANFLFIRLFWLAQLDIVQTQTIIYRVTRGEIGVTWPVANISNLQEFGECKYAIRSGFIVSREFIVGINNKFDIFLWS